MKTRFCSGFVALILSVTILSGCKDSESQSDNAESSLLFPVKENSRYGYMNSSGKIVVAPAFDYAWDLQDGMGRIKDKGKYGFINEKGELVVKPQFAYADDFKDGFARVNTKDTTVLDVQYDGYNLNGGWTFINRKGIVYSQTFAKAEYLKTGYAQVKDDPAYDAAWSYATLTEENLTREDRNTEAIFSFNGHAIAPASDPTTGKIGAINKLEEWVIQPSFDAIEPFSEGLAAAKKDNQYGYIDTNGNWIYQQVVSVNDYYYPGTDFRPFSNGMAAVKFGTDSYGYIDKTGKVLFNQKFRTASSFNEEGYAIVSTDAGTGLIDKTGAFVIKPNVDIVNVNKGIAIFRVNMSYGARDIKTQKEIVPPVYDNVELVGQLLRLRNKGATFGFINKTGSFVVEPQFERAWPLANGKAIVERKDKYEYIDKYGKVIGSVPEKEQPYYYAPSSLMYARQVNDKYGFARPDQEELAIPASYDFATDFEGDVARVNIGATLNEELWEYRGGKWGLIDASGKQIVPVTHELILPFRNNTAMFNSGGEASYSMCDGECDEAVYYSCKGGKWGLMDRKGKIIIDPIYQSMIPFGDNFLAAEDSVYKVVDGKGAELYPAQLKLSRSADSRDEIQSWFKPVILKLSENGKTGLMDSNGKWIIQPEFEDIAYNNETSDDPFANGMIAVKNNSLWGLADRTGNVVVAPAYESIRPFASGLAAVQKDGAWGFINDKNEMVIAPQYEAVRDFQGDVAIVQPAKDGGEGVIDKKGTMVFAPTPGVTFDYAGFQHGLCVINGTEENSEAGYPVSTSGVINSKGRIIFSKNALSEVRIQPGGILYAIKDGKWAVATHQGAMLTGYSFSWIEPYSGQELIRCNKGGEIAYSEYGGEDEAYGGLWGFIDKTGAVKINFIFTELGSFSEGLAPARTAEDLDEVGYADFSGKIIRPLTR
jgi:hypothetical protein